MVAMCGCGLDQEHGDRAQRLVGVPDAARAQHALDLGEVAVHGGGQRRAGGVDLLPTAEAQRAAHEVTVSG
jgi:hypothetical protein